MKSPEEWIEEEVGPNLDDYLNDPWNARKARTAVISAHHLSDRVFHYYREHDRSALLGAKTEPEFVRRIIDSEQCPALDLVRRVANASKHHFPESEMSKSWPFTATGWSEHTDDGLVIIGTDNHSVERAIREVIEFWKAWCEQHPIDAVNRM